MRNYGQEGGNNLSGNSCKGIGNNRYEGVETKEQSKGRHTRLFAMEANRKTALLDCNHAQLSSKPPRSQQNLRNGGTTRGGGVTLPRVATTSYCRTKKLLGRDVNDVKNI